MSLPLPTPLSVFFDLSNGAAGLRPDDCFAEDAVVFDEGGRHRGHEAIDAWLQDARQRYAYTVEPLDAAHDDSRITVTAIVTGNFLGSPIRLEHRFDLTEDRIQSLEIR